MSKHTKKEFAELCNMPTKTLSVYIGRGKVVLTGDIIDDTLPDNKYFLERFSAPKKELNANPQESPQPNPQRKQNERSSENYSGGLALDQRLKVLSAKKGEVELSMMQIKEEKLRGEVIPTDLVTVAFAQQFKTVYTGFKNSIEVVIGNIAKRKKLNVVEVAEIRSELDALLNRTINDSIDESKKHVTNIVVEYSTKRGVGERK